MQTRVSDDDYKDTSTTIPCPALKSSMTYLIDTYTTKDKGFFENLDAVESALYQLAVYPRAVYDTSKPSPTTPYPFLAVSPYEELSLNDHYEVFERSENGLFLRSLYPYVLDSLGWPGTISAVAKRLDPTCEVSRGGVHWEVEVTKGGETHSYGWAGEGGSGPIFANKASVNFTFDGSTNDLATLNDIATLRDQYLAYITASNADLAVYEDLIQGETFKKTIGPGSWIRVAWEGWGGTTFAYVAGRIPGDTSNGTHTASDAWVDGRYINTHNCLDLGATFADHPTANIIVRNKSYVDYYGNKRQCDVVYEYCSSTDDWRAPLYYTVGWYRDDVDLPDEFILTRQDVEAMSVDGDTNRIPLSGLVYDGTEYPGTPFTSVLATGITLDQTATVKEGGSSTINASVTPANATDQAIIWSSSDESIATVSDGYVTGVKEGTATITAKTRDGGYEAKCTLTVLGAAYLDTFKGAAKSANLRDLSTDDWYMKVPDGAFPDSETLYIDYTIGRGLMTGYKDKTGNVVAFGPHDPVNRAQTATILYRLANPDSKATTDPAYYEANTSGLSDVESGQYYTAAVNWCVANGIITGYKDKSGRYTTFGPKDPVSREQLATMIFRYCTVYAKRPADSDAEMYFSDYYRINDWAREGVAYCVANKIVSGYSDGSDRFGPADTATRCQMSKIIAVTAYMLE